MPETRYLKFRRNARNGPGYAFCELAAETCVLHVEEYQGRYFLDTGGLALDWSSIDEAAHAAVRDARAWTLTSATFEAVVAEARSSPILLSRRRRPNYGWPFRHLMRAANAFFNDERGLRYGRGVFAAGALFAASVWILGWWISDAESFERDAGTTELPWQVALAVGTAGVVLWGHLTLLWVRLVRASRALDREAEELPVGKIGT